jgi:hypothetical protein
MKTNRFEEILRRKLESVQPDFQDQDWDKWQAFKQHHTPSFWQSYGHWLGYAVATLTMSVMIVLYVRQTDQNEILRQEMEGLKKQMQAQNGSANGVEAPVQENRTTGPVRDTVYIIERHTVYREVPRAEADQPEEQSPAPLPDALEKRLGENEGIASQPVSEAFTPATGASLSDTQTGFQTSIQEAKPVSEEKALPIKRESMSKNQPSDTRLAIREPKQAINPPAEEPDRTDGTTDAARMKKKMLPSAGTRQSALPQPVEAERVKLDELTELPRAQEFSNSRSYLYRRLQARMPRKAPGQVLAPTVAQAEPEKTQKSAYIHKIRDQKAEGQNAPLAQASDQKAEEIKKEENLLPKLDLGLPYRVSASQAWLGSTKAFAVGGEFLVGRHWAVQAGLSWHRLPNQRFYNEKIFRDNMREDFRQHHAKRLPQNFDIINITTQTTLLRIPLGITYRGEMGNNFTYMIGTGTNLNLRAQQHLTYDFRLPNRDYGQQNVMRYVHIPVINNIQFSAGIEKRWSPIVLQTSSFLESRLKTFPFLKDRTNVGFQIKVLYELGGSKKTQ